MNPIVLELVADCPKAMAQAQSAAIREVLSMGACLPPLVTPAAPPVQATAKVTVSIECWRDANGKLHCKLSVSFSAA